MVRFLGIFVLLASFAIPSPYQEDPVKNGISNGNFSITFRVADALDTGEPGAVKQKRSLLEDVAKSLKTGLDIKEFELTRNIVLKADVMKTSSGKILNGVMVSIEDGTIPRGSYFPCNIGMPEDYYKEKVFNTSLASLMEHIKAVLAKK